LSLALLKLIDPYLQNEVYSSSYAAATYLKSINFTKKAYIVGGQGIGDELKEAGIEYRGVEVRPSPLPLSHL